MILNNHSGKAGNRHTKVDILRANQLGMDHPSWILYACSTVHNAMQDEAEQDDELSAKQGEEEVATATSLQQQPLENELEKQQLEQRAITETVNI